MRSDQLNDLITLNGSIDGFSTIKLVNFTNKNEPTVDSFLCEELVAAMNARIQ